tara:strand:- start:233 stop:751 length:519 start_codon:yes stop_codon:yes gene_type:complete
MWISAEVLHSDQVTRLLRLKRLVVVDCEGTTMDRVQAYLNECVFEVESSEPVPERFETVPATPAPPMIPVVEDPEPESAQPEHAERGEEGSEDAAQSAPVEEVPKVVDPPVPGPLAEPETEGTEDRIYAMGELVGMHYRNELQPLARRLGLNAGGTKAVLAQRIIDFQKEQS